MFSYVLKKWSCYISDTAVTYFLAKYIGEGKKKKQLLVMISTVLHATKIGQKYRKIKKGCPNCVDILCGIHCKILLSKREQSFQGEQTREREGALGFAMPRRGNSDLLQTMLETVFCSIKLLTCCLQIHRPLTNGHKKSSVKTSHFPQAIRWSDFGLFEAIFHPQLAQCGCEVASFYL